MLSPADLLELAEEFSARIPPGPEYLEDRNSAWLAIGEAWLKLNDGASAMRALAKLDHRRCDAVLRHGIAMWTVQSPLFDSGCDPLHDIEFRAAHFSRRELGDLVVPLLRLGGEMRVREFANQIDNPSNVLTTLSYFVRSDKDRRETLEAAERLANDDGDLLAVQRGYRAAGLEENAQRLLSTMPMQPAQIDETFLAAEKALEAAEAILARHIQEMPPDTQIARLRRFLEYKFNDLKVHFLADAAVSGGVADAEIEALLMGDAFRAVEAPRAPGIRRNPPNLEPPAFADFIFNRPVCHHHADQSLLDGSDCFDEDPQSNPEIQHCVAALFEAFGQIAPRYSMEQIDQGLWLLLGGRFYNTAYCDSMLNPFRDYYASVGDEYEGTAFYMWWDQIRAGPVALPVLEKILAMPSERCQTAALHGLNHMRPDPQAAAIVTRYIEENRHRLEPDDLEFAEECRDGRAL